MLHTLFNDIPRLASAKLGQMIGQVRNGGSHGNDDHGRPLLLAWLAFPSPLNVCQCGRRVVPREESGNGVAVKCQNAKDE